VCLLAPCISDDDVDVDDNDDIIVSVCVCVVGWTIIVALSTSDGSLTFSVQLGSHSQLIPLSLSLSVSLSVCLSLCLSVYVLLLVSYCVQMLVDLSFLCKFVNI